MHHGIRGLFHGYVEYGPLRVIQYLLKGLFPREGVGCYGGACLDELAHYAALFNYADIVGGVGGAGHKEGELCYVHYPACGGKLACPVQRVYYGNAVHCLAPLVK